jgi:hypothetical protein
VTLVRFLAALVFIGLTASLLAQATMCEPAERDFKLLMPGSVIVSGISTGSQTANVQGAMYSAVDDISRVTASRWSFTRGGSRTKITLFVRELKRAFQVRTGSTLDGPPIDKAVGNIHGQYLTFTVRDTRMGLWVTVQPDSTIYTVSFGSSRRLFSGVESKYLPSFVLIPK